MPDNNENENLPNNGGGGSSSNGGGNSKPDTESKPENQTGSTTETKPDGTKVETIQKPDGGTVVITTQTNGTVTTVETSNDKTVTTTVEDNDGNKTESIKRADGTETITIQKTDGSNSVTEFDKNGNIKTEVTVTNEAISAAEDKKETITLPMPSLPLAYNKETAPVVNIALPEGTSAKVEIPVEYVTKGTVAVIINADGSEEVVKTTLLTENGIAFKLSQGQSVKIVDNSKAFDDVAENHWGADAVHFASSRELFVGMSEKTFAPNETMTRAMVWTVLARLEGVKDTGERWYHSGRNWAVENGISDGTDEHGEVTREQLSAMLYRYAKLCGYDVSIKSDLGSFEDTEKISDYALESVQWANAAGIVMGTSDTVLDVHKNSTRAQVAMMLKNFCEKVVE